MLPDPLLGAHLGKDYRVVEEIGRGGMAVVYLVEHQTLLKQFAAKVLSAELTANFEARARFTQEAHAASQLDHENIVGISDFGVTADQRPFFVMELLRGQTLDQRIAQGPMTLEEIVAVAVPIGRALAHAHAEGVVHRDVKPENIFLVQRRQGRWGVKVVDFGIAKAPVGNSKLTKMGQTLGSPMFMAPEACRGEDVDHRADIYSLGILLYLMLCGRVPFEDESLLKVLQLQVTAPLPPPRQVNPELSPELAVVLEQALAKDPDARFPSMLDLLDAFEAALPPDADRLLLEVQRGSTQAIRTTPFPGVTLTPRPVRGSATNLPAAATAPGLTAAAPSRRNVKIVAALAIVLALLAIVFGVQQLMHSPSPRDVGTPTATTTPTAPATPTTTESSASKVVAAGEPAAGSATVVAPPVQPPLPTAPPPGPVTPPTVPVVITSTPVGAAVVLDGVKLGVTPLELSVDRAERTGELVLTRKGYARVTRSVDLRDRVQLDLALVADAPPPRVTRKPPKAEDKKPPRPDPPKGDPALDIRMSR